MASFLPLSLFSLLLFSSLSHSTLAQSPQGELPTGYTQPKCGFTSEDPAYERGSPTPAIYDQICTAQCFCLDSKLPFVPKNSLLCSSTDSRDSAFMRIVFQRCRAGCHCGDGTSSTAAQPSGQKENVDVPGTLFVIDREAEEDWWALKALNGRDIPGQYDQPVDSGAIATVERNKGYPWALCNSVADCGNRALAAAGYAWQCVVSSTRTIVSAASTVGLAIAYCRMAGIDPNIGGRPVGAYINDGFNGVAVALRGGFVPLITSLWYAIKQKIGMRLPEAIGGPRRNRLGGGPGQGRLDGVSRLVAAGNNGKVKRDGGVGEEWEERGGDGEEERMLRMIEEWDRDEVERIRAGLHVCACNATYVSKGCCSAGSDGMVWEDASERVEVGELNVDL